MTDTSNFGYGQQDPFDSSTEFGKYAFVISQALGQIATIKVVKVVAVSNSGDVSPVGTVDVMPLVNQVDGLGNSIPHGTVFSLPYFRLQGGTNAVIMDPQVGDIGLAAVADRDISAVKNTKAQANPGSNRRFALADGLYIGGFLNGTPKQYIQVNSSGINVVTLGGLTLSDNNGNSISFGATGITVKGNLIVENNLQLGGQVESVTGGLYAGNFHIGGTLTADTDVSGGGKSLKTHVHSGVTVGGADTGPPV